MDRLAWYRRIAPSYDLICGPLYATPRRLALEALRLAPGERVIDMGCGTGLALPSLAVAVGDSGSVIGVDGSPAMLARAQARTLGLPQVELQQGDLHQSATYEGLRASGPVDALLFGLSLAVVEDWQAVFEASWKLLRPGGRCAIYDTRPLQGAFRFLNPVFVPVVGWTGAAQLRRRTWELLDECSELHHRSEHLGGFVHVRAGTKLADDENR